jgi:hypothetical protein
MKLFGVDLFAMAKAIFAKTSPWSVFQDRREEFPVISELSIWKRAVILLVASLLYLASLAMLVAWSIAAVALFINVIIPITAPYINEYLFRHEAQNVIDKLVPVTDAIRIERTLTLDLDKHIGCFLVRHEEGTSGLAKKQIYSVNTERKSVMQVTEWKDSALCPAREN